MWTLRMSEMTPSSDRDDNQRALKCHKWSSKIPIIPSKVTIATPVRWEYSI